MSKRINGRLKPFRYRQKPLAVVYKGITLDCRRLRKPLARRVDINWINCRLGEAKRTQQNNNEELENITRYRGDVDG